MRRHPGAICHPQPADPQLLLSRSDSFFARLSEVDPMVRFSYMAIQSFKVEHTVCLTVLSVLTGAFTLDTLLSNSDSGSN